METVTTLGELWAARARLARPIGLVPTMGFLHAGHLSLVARARQECASLVATIFVNPTQFGPNEDLEAYPRDLAGDLAKFEAAGVNLVWTPTAGVMYPPDFQTWVQVDDVTRRLEGAMRPGHFRGVTTIVAKLFNGVGPDRAYFGQKDAQQAAVIRRMVRDLNFPIQIVVCPTLREADGLAMSSRNSYLNPQERRAAVVLFHALQAARNAYQRGERDAGSLRKIMEGTIRAEPLARMEYVSCADPVTLTEIEGPVEKALLSMAVFIGRTRLIDNWVLEQGGHRPEAEG